MSPVKNEQERREIVRRLQQEDLRADERLAEIESERMQIQSEKAKRKDKRLRAEGPFPAGEICPDCWVNHGKENPLHPIPHDDQKHYDLWRCSACGFDDERRIGR